MNLLIQIRDYIRDAQKEISLSELSHHFDQPEEVMQDMVKRWVDKGVIERLTIISDLSCAASACGNSKGCSGCPSALAMPKMMVFYKWKDSV